jgi:hypothetical protein
MKIQFWKWAIPIDFVFTTILVVVIFRNDSRTESGDLTKAQTHTEQAQKPIRLAAGSPAVRPPDPSRLQKVSSHPMAVSFGKSPGRVAEECSILLEILQFYRQEFGAFPTGEDNASIMNALKGNNPSGLPIFPSEHPRFAEDGSLLDAWGKPFFFHTISSQQIEVRSLGPDRIIFTDDDISVPMIPESPEAR